MKFSIGVERKEAETKEEELMRLRNTFSISKLENQAKKSHEIQDVMPKSTHKLALSLKSASQKSLQ